MWLLVLSLYSRRVLGLNLDLGLSVWSSYVFLVDMWVFCGFLLPTVQKHVRSAGDSKLIVIVGVSVFPHLICFCVAL